MNKSLAPTALMLGNFVTGVAVLAPAGMLGDLAKDLGVSVYQAGLFITFGALVMCVGSPVMTWSTSRADRRLVLVGTMVGIAISHATALLAPGYDSFMVLRLAMLAIAAIFTPLAAGAAALIVPENKRHSTIVYVMLGWSLALAFGLPLVTYLTAHVGWRETLGGIGLLALLVSLLIALSLPKGLFGVPVELQTWMNLGRSRLVLLLLTISVLQMAGLFCVYPYLGPLLSRLTQATPETIGMAFGMFGVCALFGNMLAVRVVDVIGPFRTSIIFSVTLLLGSLVWIIGVGVAALPVLLLASVLWGFGFAAMVSMQQTRLVGAAPIFASASVALNASVGYIGQAVGSGLGGAFFTNDRVHANGYVGMAFFGIASGVLFLTRPASDSRPKRPVRG